MSQHSAIQVLVNVEHSHLGIGRHEKESGQNSRSSSGGVFNLLSVSADLILLKDKMILVGNNMNVDGISR